jgi:F-type H+-transporting ATPase subunit gamma
VPIHSDFINIFSRLNYGHAKDISERVIDAYTKAEFDAVYIIYNEFKSIIQQRLVVEKLLPFDRGELGSAGPGIDYIYEQEPQEIFNRLLPRYVETQIFEHYWNRPHPSTELGWPRWIPPREMRAK